MRTNWIHPKTVDWLYFGLSQPVFVLFDFGSSFFGEWIWGFIGFVKSWVKKNKTWHQEKSYRFYEEEKSNYEIIELSNPDSQISNCPECYLTFLWCLDQIVERKVKYTIKNLRDRELYVCRT